MVRRGQLVAALFLALAAAVWSYAAGGLVHVLVDAALEPDGVERVRSYVLSWGALAPAVYVGAVIVEVLLAPRPGTLLYAPGGAIFGGLVGGTLSLAGNVAGAVVATWIGRSLGGPWVSRRIERRHLGGYRDRLTRRAVWAIFLLRVNPFTSSDLVSYAAGAFGVRVLHVAAGTLAGMAPLCYLQAYLAATVFTIVPASGLVIAVFGVAYVIALAFLLMRRSRT